MSKEKYILRRFGDKEKTLRINMSKEFRNIGIIRNICFVIKRIHTFLRHFLAQRKCSGSK